MVKENKTHPDLTNIDGSFASAVEANSRTLARLIDDDSVSVEDVKEFCFEMMDSCKQTPWIRNARVKLERMHDKNEMAFFIYNSMLSGANLKRL